MSGNGSVSISEGQPGILPQAGNVEGKLHTPRYLGGKKRKLKKLSDPKLIYSADRLRRMKERLMDKRAAWDESKHPRAADGKFGAGGGSGEKASTEQKSKVSSLLDRAKSAWDTAKPVLGAIFSVIGQFVLGAAVPLIIGALAHRFRGHRYRHDPNQKWQGKTWAEWEQYYRSSQQGGQEWKDAYEQFRRHGYSGRGDQKARSTHVEDPAAAAVRAAHGAKAAHIMALYLRAATPGEKAAAQAALSRMGIETSKFGKAARDSLWAALDPWLTEEEAQAILDALLDQLTPEQAEKILACADKIDPTLTKFVQPLPIVPRTLYVSRPVVNGAALVAWAKSQGFATTLPEEDLHVTVAFSRTAVEWPADESRELVIPAGDNRAVVQFSGGAVVLRIVSPELAHRWAEFCNIGASWDWPEYHPHITISYNGEGVDLNTVEPYAGPIELGGEVFAEVQEDWKDNVVEKLFDESKHPRGKGGKFALGRDAAMDVTGAIRRRTKAGEAGTGEAYHGASFLSASARAKLTSIMEFGLQPQFRAGGAKWYADHSTKPPAWIQDVQTFNKGYVFFTKSKEHALKFATMTTLGTKATPLVLKLDIPKEAKRKVEYDVLRMSSGEPGGQSFRFKGTIKPDWIKGYFDTKQTEGKRELGTYHELRKADDAAYSYAVVILDDDDEGDEEDDTMQKAGARHSKKDQAMVQSMHDHALSLGAQCSYQDEPDGDDLPSIEKSIVRIAKVDEKLGVVFGYAIVCKVNGEPYYDLNVDLSGPHLGKRVPEHIPEETMLKACVEFMQSSRAGNEMHSGPDQGTFVCAFPLTTEIAKAMGIKTNVTGLLVGFKPPPELLSKFKDGTLKGFSIEGTRVAYLEHED